MDQTIATTEVLQRFHLERQAFFDWLDSAAARNAVQNADLTDKELLAIIEQARSEAAADRQQM